MGSIGWGYRGQTIDILLKQKMLENNEETLMLGEQANFVLDLRLDCIDRIRANDIQSDGLAWLERLD